MIIVDGSARVTRESDDGVATVATVGAGDIVGEMALLSGHPRGRRTATVTATTDLEFYVLTPSEFHQVLDIAPSVAEKVHQVAEARTVALAEARTAA
jgi:CRP-like cAMP-binding protein